MTKPSKSIKILLIFTVVILFISGMMMVNYEVQQRTYAQEQEKQAYIESLSNDPIDYIAEQENAVEAILEPVTKWIDFKATAYCACIKCCGKTNGITASGVKAIEGVTIAADWNVLPKETVVYIQGIGYRTIQDKGGAIKGNKIDVYFNNHETAKNFGVKKLKVKVMDNGMD